MVYSTCTFSPEENEGTILGFLREHPDFYIERVPSFPGFSEGRPDWEGETDDSYGLSRTIRIFPHKARGEGHYIAVLRRKGQEPEEMADIQGTEAIKGIQLEQYLEFARNSLKDAQMWRREGRDVLFGDRLYRTPALSFSLAGLKVMRPGLELGSFKTKRFEPSHGMAMALKPEDVKCFISLDPEGEDVFRYLRGETLNVDFKIHPWLEGRKGWILVCAGPFSIGWGKLSGNVMKNHYPRGLRIQ